MLSCSDVDNVCRLEFSSEQIFLNKNADVVVQ